MLSIVQRAGRDRLETPAVRIVQTSEVTVKDYTMPLVEVSTTRHTTNALRRARGGMSGRPTPKPMVIG
jgi:hypothetical protein